MLVDRDKVVFATQWLSADLPLPLLVVTVPCCQNWRPGNLKFGQSGKGFEVGDLPYVFFSILCVVVAMLLLHSVWTLKGG